MKKLEYLVIDVDGNMTDGGIYYDSTGNEIKRFCAFDAAGILAARFVGIKIIVITGRECNATIRRLEELGIDLVFQGVREKESFLANFMKERNIQVDSIGYIGDDLNDYKAMKLVGFRACPGNACEEIKAISDYVGTIMGGYGAVREIIRYVLKKRNEWDQAIFQLYGAEAINEKA